jgi:hypothetical protein
MSRSTSARAGRLASAGDSAFSPGPHAKSARPRARGFGPMVYACPLSSPARPGGPN